MNTSTQGVLIHGPAGCGKTRNGHALARHFGKSTVIDDWTSHTGAPVPDFALALTNEAPAPAGSIPFAVAMRAAGLSGAKR